MPKTYMQGLSSDFKQFFFVKNNFVCFKEQICFPKEMLWKKINPILTGKKYSK